ncbi:MAG: hypothetical protein H0X34_16965 [Chthoniobacterales bacterium]|nr:hypothetical protein [Chthoniobacterales bacterium]
MAHEKERLNGAHLAFLIFQNEEVIVEISGQRRADELVKAIVLALVAKSFVPGWNLLQLLLPNERGKAIRRPDAAIGRRARSGY